MDHDTRYQRLTTVSRRVIDEVDRDLNRRAGLHLSYAEILGALAEIPGHRLRMSELADKVCVSRSRLSHAIARLAGRGLIERAGCDDDGRGQFASLTEAGIEAAREAMLHHTDVVREQLVDRLTPLQIEQLLDIIDTLSAVEGRAPTS